MKLLFYCYTFKYYMQRLPAFYQLLESRIIKTSERLHYCRM